MFDPYLHLNITPNADGTITRNLDLPSIPANPEATKGETVVSKDVTLSSEKGTWVRIYRPTKLPSNDNMVARLPILLYFHGGGFVALSASFQGLHQACSSFAAEIPAIVVSLNYRLAPENRLPAQYDDGLDAIHWIRDQALMDNGEQWLKDYGDFSRCYIFGHGCGGTIVFHAAIRAVDLEIEPLKISGLIFNQPMFGGKERTISELNLAADQLLPLPVLDLLWELALPMGADRDHPYCNPFVEGPHRGKIEFLPKCLIIGFNGDILADRMQVFVTLLVSSGAQVQAYFHDLAFGDIDAIDPSWASWILNITKEFIV